MEETTATKHIKNIVTAHDLSRRWRGVDAFYVARMIDISICTRHKYKIDKFYRRNPNPKGTYPKYPVPYHLIETDAENNMHICKEIFIPQPYAIMEHFDEEYELDFSGIVFDETEIAEFEKKQEYIKDRFNIENFYTVGDIVLKCIAENSQESAMCMYIMQMQREFELKNEVLQRTLFALIGVSGELSLQEMQGWDVLGDKKRMEQVEQKLREYQENPAKSYDSWVKSVEVLARYAYDIGKGIAPLPSKGEAWEYRKQTKHPVVKQAFEAFWRGLPDEAKKFEKHSSKNKRGEPS